MISIDLIDEDPEQPRSADNPGFRPESIQELANSFGPKGPKTPLSLRDNPKESGRYIINHGHRRFRACKVKKLDEVPAFIDNDYDVDDQIIENIQREGQSPREIAERIGIKQAAGAKNKDIAARWGKSGSWVTQYATLLDLPEPIAAVFNAGRANDVTVVNELVTAYKGNPEEVTDWLSVPTQEISRGEVRLLREFLAEKNKGGSTMRDPNTLDIVFGETDAEADEGAQGDKPKKEKGRNTDPDKLKKAIVQVEHDGRPARLMLSKRPPAEGYAWIKYEDDGQQFEASLTDVRLVALIEG
ncbi:ParB/RepB/Spo0J family partition protein [Massilia sp. R798]|uniref:ParB/RepB/Spo0J family partition protein n=2 Tax=Massilia soli TaxID=2792854 RepID=A0ABS7SLI3_9BURK|nr:ParB/RepB/Spo0J family partition protein [Massilia soli]